LPCVSLLRVADFWWQDAEDCVRTKPDWSKGYYRLGHTLALLHRYEEAQTALKKGLQIEPSNADISARLKEVDATLKKESTKRAKANKANLTPCMAAKEEGNALYKDGKFPEAIVSVVSPRFVSYVSARRWCTREPSRWRPPTRKRWRC
jgi:tetratricopeptide (TPR) repeat protein